MNILLISSLYPTTAEPSAEGVTSVLHSFVKHWHQDKNREVNVLVVCPVYLYVREWFTRRQNQLSGKSFRSKIISLDNVPIIVFPIFKIPRIAYFYYPLYRYLNKYLKTIDFKPDVVVAHYDKSLYIGYRYSRMRELPLVVGLHITPDLVEDDPTAFAKRCGSVLEAASAIACRSQYIYNKIQKWFPHYREKSFIAFSGIEEDLIENPENAAARMRQWKTGKTGGKVSIISVCSLIERKKIDTNLRALARLKDKFDWTYTIIGEGEERPHLEALTVQLGIQSRVRFKGTVPRRQVIEALKRSHIFVMVSYLETFGLVYLEAMAAGNIVIGGRGEGIDGVIQHEKNGFLSLPGQVEPLKNLLETIILQSSTAELENILKNAHQTIREYNDENAARNYWQQLEKAVG
ncbi:MAG: glycosyltransferase [Candidatus Aminicenantes bacterium]|nr:glycosyltransferase [Candidatus Aminicenantes bacterium]NIM78853.1 glycosyltransferase [Candidatus Aminicenantes bacterium]NIN18109.1 glycosyltransferase [Candidatus Aminicenantes bacterium]NIN42008.1 glycosyltransferase [Candidatus Aminicenantes bacterium]NIN84764.1 glycosyltransferase [Candidatus Aminicenantes bacterium]